MNRFLNVREFAESLRLEGNEFANEILEALDFQEFSEHDELVEDIQHYAPEGMEDPRKIVEWLGDRSNLLNELRDILDQNDYKGVDIDDAVNQLLDDLKDAEESIQRMEAAVEYDL